MVKTYGLTHIALAVQDPERTLRFYQQLFGVQEYFRDESTIHGKTPGAQDVITFVQRTAWVNQPGGVIHVAFVQDPDGYEVEIWFE